MGNDAEYKSFCFAMEDDIKNYNCRFYRNANRWLKLSSNAFLIFQYLLGEQDYANKPSNNNGKKGTRRNPNEFAISFRDLAEAMGKTKNNTAIAQRAINELEERKLIKVFGKKGITLGYTVDYYAWNDAIIKGEKERIKSMDSKRKRKKV